MTLYYPFAVSFLTSSNKTAKFRYFVPLQYRSVGNGLQVTTRSSVLDGDVKIHLYAPRPIWITALEQPTGPFSKHFIARKTTGGPHPPAFYARGCFLRVVLRVEQN